MKKALVVGLGGIGKNVYLPQFEKQGYTVETVDINPALNATYRTVQDIPAGFHFDMAVICLPNIYHLPAMLTISDFCKKILVEKPGFHDAGVWQRNLARPELDDHEIVLVKNNLYRHRIEEDLGTMCDPDHVAKVEITWFNKDRIPNPGSWFTSKTEAFGGVTHDLFPHLYCFLYILFPLFRLVNAKPTVLSIQRWNLDTLGDRTDYGSVNKNGVYDVCDYAEAHYLIDGIPVTLAASWKEGYDKQDITIYYKDGSTFHWDFGLCPDEAYGEMIRAFEGGRFMNTGVHQVEKRFDLWIHEQLEYFS